MEIEMKFKCNNLESAKKCAKQLGFKFSKRLRQKDTYYICNKKIGDTQRYFRIREGLNASMDYHIARNSLETEEFETKISNPKIAKKIFHSIGLRPVCIVKKYREEYFKENILLVFDKVANLGNFVEIEMQGRATKKIENDMKAIAAKLGLKKQVTKVGYPDLILRKRLSKER